MSIIFGEADDDKIERLTDERDRALKDIAALRECVAMARVIIERIETVDASSSENINRAKRWISLSSELIHRTSP